MTKLEIPSTEMTSEEAGFGVQLQRAREAAGCSRADMAARLNVVEDYILWLENEQLDDLPGPTFTRGYVRSYAKYLGLSPDQLVEQYNIQTGQKAKPLKPLVSRRQVRASDPIVRWSTFGIILLFMALSMVWWKSQQDALVVGRAAVISDAIAVETAAGKVVVTDGGAQLVAAETRVQEPAGSSIHQAPELSPQTKAVDDIVQGAQSTEPLLTNKLQLRFKDTSWVEVQDANKKVLFTGVKNAGEQLELASDYLFDIVIGNAAAVKLSYNSTPVDLAGYTNDVNVAKLTLGKD